MNIITKVTARIEARMTETKNPCKHYKTEAAADAATAKMAQFAANHFRKNQTQEPRPANYIVFEVKNLGWVGAIDLTGLINRPDMTGGYLCCCTGFFTY